MLNGANAGETAGDTPHLNSGWTALGAVGGLIALVGIVVVVVSVVAVAVRLIRSKA